MKQTQAPVKGIAKGVVIIGLIAALGAGFAAGWLVRDARQPVETESAEGASEPDLSARIDELKAHLAGEPRDAKAWVSLGHLYFDSNQPGPAVEAYAKYLELSPGDADVLTDQGVMYRELHQPAKAIACFDAALAVNPGHEIARFNKAIVLLSDLGDKAGALASFDALLRINPNAKAPGGRPVAELIRELRPEVKQKPAMLIDK